jgi:signal transduction histidine kinase
MSIWKKIVPRSLSGRLIALMLLALALAQGASLLVYRFERNRAVRDTVRDECLGRAASTIRLMDATPPEQRGGMLETVATPLTRYWVTDGAPGEVERWCEKARGLLLRPLPAQGEGHVAESLFAHSRMLDCAPDGAWAVLPAETWLLRRPIHMMDLTCWNGFAIAAPLGDGEWLNMVYAKPPHLATPTPSPGYYATLVLSIGIFAAAAWLIARHIVLPLRRLTEAAEKLGRGEEVAALPEEGPEDIRTTVATFNRMHVRLRRFLEDRTQMLAAIGHDLRTPITSLRLRAEFVQDAETREKLLATIAEMQAMTEAGLAFASSEATAEPTRAVDLTSLIESLCDDLAELGWEVRFENENGERTPCSCRPDALRRALRNLIENAVRYGMRATVTLETTADTLEITVDDEGPGIPPEDRERVFAPFVRLDSSRNPATGGVGLGLSIARSIVRAHGGDILLEDAAVGARVKLVLPRATESR